MGGLTASKRPALTGETAFTIRQPGGQGNCPFSVHRQVGSSELLSASLRREQSEKIPLLPGYRQ